MTNKIVHVFTVVSPEYETYSFNGIDPPEYGCDVVQIECEKRDAKALALKTPEFSTWLGEARGDGISPFTGLQVIPTICDHGKCFCAECYAKLPCDKCEELSMKVLASLPERPDLFQFARVE